MKITELRKVYEGKSKVVFAMNQESEYLIQFKDDLTAFNALKKGSFDGKGELSQKIATMIYSELSENQIPHHLIQPEQVDGASAYFWRVKKLNMIPLEVVVRNRAAGSLVKRLGMKEAQELKQPLVEFYYKSDALQDPFVSDDQILMMEILQPQQIAELKKQALKLNQVLAALFDRSGLILVDFKVEYGFSVSGDILLGDDLTPDCFRAWDKVTMEKYDKDRFRFDLGDVKQGYSKIYDKLSAGRKK